jgi:predicted regulator of Ras-like GTPase activity (Roadblock/LC7/MglB family)
MFRDSIQKAIDRLDGEPGASGILMGFDGIPVDSYSRPDAADLQTVSMEYSHVLAQVRKAAATQALGEVDEVTIRTQKLAVLIRVVTSEYFLAFGLRPDGNLGKARYLLRVLAPQIRAEL